MGLIIGIGLAIVELPNQFTDTIVQGSHASEGDAAVIVLGQFALSLLVKLGLEVPSITLRFALRKCCCCCCCSCSACNPSRCTCCSNVSACLTRWVHAAAAAIDAPISAVTQVSRVPTFDCGAWLRLLKGLLDGLTTLSDAKPRCGLEREMSVDIVHDDSRMT